MKARRRILKFCMFAITILIVENIATVHFLNHWG